jgi:hypothetical protein
LRLCLPQSFTKARVDRSKEWAKIPEKNASISLKARKKDKWSIACDCVQFACKCSQLLACTQGCQLSLHSNFVKQTSPGPSVTLKWLWSGQFSLKNRPDCSFEKPQALWSLRSTLSMCSSFLSAPNKPPKAGNTLGRVYSSVGLKGLTRWRSTTQNSPKSVSKERHRQKTKES